jgi:hypothetical protein
MVCLRHGANYWHTDNCPICTPAELLCVWMIKPTMPAKLTKRKDPEDGVPGTTERSEGTARLGA